MSVGAAVRAASSSVKLETGSGDHRESGEAREGDGDTGEARFHSELSLSTGAVRAVCDQGLRSLGAHT